MLPTCLSRREGAPTRPTRTRLGSSHQHAGQAPPYRGHKAKFAPCETPPGRVGFGAEVGFSIYIHRRGFTSTTTNSHQPSLLPPKACGRGRAGARPTRAARPTGAPYARAHYALHASTLRERTTRTTRAPCAATLCAHGMRARPTRALSPLPRARPAPGLHARSASSHQHAGQAHHAGVLHPPVAGFISTSAGLLRRARAEAVSCSASCRVKAYANDTARQPTPTRKPRPKGGPSTTPNTATDTGPSAWRERRH